MSPPERQPDIRDAIEKGVPWLALILAFITFIMGWVRSHDIEDTTLHERVAKLEAKVDYLKDATNRLLDAFRIEHPRDGKE